jgi:hypothetical protein
MPPGCQIPPRTSAGRDKNRAALAQHRGPLAARILIARATTVTSKLARARGDPRGRACRRAPRRPAHPLRHVDESDSARDGHETSPVKNHTRGASGRDPSRGRRTEVFRRTRPGVDHGKQRDDSPSSTLDAFHHPAFARKRTRGASPAMIRSARVRATTRPRLARHPRGSSCAFIGTTRAALRLRHRSSWVTATTSTPWRPRPSRATARARIAAGHRRRGSRGAPRRARSRSHVVSSMAVVASAVATSSSRMTVSVTRDGDPELVGDCRRRVGVALVDHPPREEVAIGARRADRRDLETGDGHQLVGHTGERGAAHDRRGRRLPGRFVPRRPPERRSPRGWGRSSTTGFDGHSSSTSAWAIASRTPVRGPRARCPRTGSLSRILRVSLHPVLLEVEVERLARGSTTSMRVVTASSVIGTTDVRQAEQASRTARRWLARGSSFVEHGVRNTCVARSRSPRLNQASTRPTRAAPPSRGTSRRPVPIRARGPSDRRANSRRSRDRGRRAGRGSRCRRRC